MENGIFKFYICFKILHLKLRVAYLPITFNFNKTFPIQIFTGVEFIEFSSLSGLGRFFNFCFFDVVYFVFTRSLP